MPATEPSIHLGRVPFYWRMRTSPDGRSDIPELLPFTFGIDPATGTIVQAKDAEVERWLARVYELDSNIGYMQPDHALADRYGQDFLAFFDRAVATLPARPRKLLDVGCGGCYVLRGLKERGYEVHGIDPSPVTVRYAERFGIPVKTGLYPLEHGWGRMDVVLSTGTLEHVQDPVAFLRGHHADLAPGGHVIVSLPDSGPQIELGDASMVLHEHVSYFDEASLRRTFLAAGFEAIHVERAGYGLSLYAIARPRAGSAPAFDRDAVLREWTAFASRLELSLERFNAWVRSVWADPSRTLGFYVPLRLLPYLGRLERTDGFRLFDDDPGVHRKLFDGVPVPIENFADLQARPVTDLAILSIPHAPVIAKKVRAAFGDAIRVVSLEAILRGEVRP